MASISDIVGKLESTKEQLDAAKTEADGALQETQEMVTQAEGMELSDTAEGLIALHQQIEAYGEQIVALAAGLDDLVTATEAFRTNATSG
jgi:citrate lyase beta subunit